MPEPTYVIAAPCLMCKKVWELVVPAAGYERWQAGTLIQVALPELSLDEREILISKICGKCYDAMFARLEEEEDDDGELDW